MGDGNVRMVVREFGNGHTYIVAYTLFTHLCYPPFCYLRKSSCSTSKLACASMRKRIDAVKWILLDWVNNVFLKAAVKP